MTDHTCRAVEHDTEWGTKKDMLDLKMRYKYHDARVFPSLRSYCFPASP